MGQYSDLVEKQRTLLEVEKWRKGVKQIMMVASPDKLQPYVLLVPLYSLHSYYFPFSYCC